MWIGPGNAVPIVDEFAALIIGPSLAKGDRLDPIVIARRTAAWWALRDRARRG